MLYTIYMYILQKRKYTYIRIWLTVVIIITAVFGFSLIIFEEWHVDQDNLIRSAPQETILYFHVNQRLLTDESYKLPPLLQFIADEYFHDFWEQLAAFEQLGFQQISFLSAPIDGAMQSAWLLATRNNQLPLEYEDSYAVGTVETMYIIASTSRMLDLVMQTYQGAHPNMTETIDVLSSRPPAANYLLYNNSTLQGNAFEQDNELERLLGLLPQGNWYMYPDDNKVVLEMAKNRPLFKLPRFSNRDAAWPLIFYDESFVVYQQDPAQMWAYFSRLRGNQTLLEAVHGWEIKYQSSFTDLLANISEPIDMVVTIPGWDASAGRMYQGGAYEWLIKIPVQQDLKDRLEEIGSLMLGYVHPVIEEGLLPDGSIVKELKARPVEMEYQTSLVADREVKIVYLSQKQEYLWYEISSGEDWIVGNSRRLLEKYLTQQGNNNTLPCLDGAQAAIVMNLPASWENQFGVSSLILVNTGEDTPMYTICY